MIREARIATLVAKASEADTEAAKAEDARSRALWLTIAKSYRALAAVP